ncbi:lipoprotein LpqV [Mycobacterium sp. URHB0044]|uniref:lipoprotein LpqV n=1 Tax=Mycobacterium sp. URHB0044 TaxID=1380386 RepID=UPI00048BF199|nr:lipoprotein LpqV [Mycobacterium sp. URHB0044]
MRSDPLRAVIAAAATCSALLAGCSSGSDGGNSPPSKSASEASSAPATSTSLQTHTADPGAVGVSPGGVTTAVGAPAESTEDEYFQACHAAKVWMTEQGGDQKALFEPYLASLQKSDTPGPGTFNTPWSQLPPSRQSAVIVAAEAAADDLCG